MRQNVAQADQNRVKSSQLGLNPGLHETDTSPEIRLGWLNTVDLLAKECFLHEDRGSITNTNK
jgi:hypothetical protein